MSGSCYGCNTNRSICPRFHGGFYCGRNGKETSGLRCCGCLRRIREECDGLPLRERFCLRSNIFRTAGARQYNGHGCVSMRVRIFY
nr:MAG TPA: hypothetical protein [Caudoviricetes sp.]DAX47855.1 MAG TPA: hypothetical protein [Caudoviricetes sp.]